MDEPEPLVFDEASIQAALVALERGETDYEDFLRRIWLAGAIEYDVNLLWRQISFCGPRGERYVDIIPPAPFGMREGVDASERRLRFSTLRDALQA